MRYKAILILALLLGIIVISAAQFSVPVIFGPDGYLHIRMASFIREYGVKYDFHWARYSTFKDNFADKDFLYHALLIPFTFLPDIFFGAKLSTCLLGIFLYLVFWRLLRIYADRRIVLLFLLLFLLSPSFLQAISQARNMVFVIALTLVFAHFLIKKHQWGLFFLAVIYSLSHVSGPYLLLFAFLAEGVRFVNEREFCWRSMRAAALGIALGYLIHPNFPNNFLNFYLNGVLVPIYALKWGLELGAEFFPLNTRDFVLGYPFILIGLLFLIATVISRQRKIKTSTAIWMSIAGFFFVFSFFSQRYIMHSYPVILLFLAAYFSDWLSSGKRFLLAQENKMLKGLMAGGFSVILLFSGVNTYQRFRDNARGELMYNGNYEAVGRWMRDNIPAGELVFHANWSDSQYLIGINPQNDYFVTFDPIYMHYWDPEKYKLYRDVAFGSSRDPYGALKDDFKACYGYVSKNYFSGLINQVRNDRRFEVMAENEFGLVFHLR